MTASKPTFHIYWNEKSNHLAAAEVELGSLPLLTILDDEYTGINPFYSYPFIYLEMLGWVDLGEL